MSINSQVIKSNKHAKSTKSRELQSVTSILEHSTNDLAESLNFLFTLNSDSMKLSSFFSKSRNDAPALLIPNSNSLEAPSLLILWMTT